MRIALITPTLIPYHAVPNSIINKFRALIKAGHDVSVFTQKLEPDNLPPEMVEKTYIISTDKIKKFNDGKEPFTEVLEKWFDADLYLFDYPHYYPFIEEIRRVEGITGFIYHGITPPAFAETGKKSLYSTSILYINSLKCADFGIIYSKYTKNELINKYKFNPQKLIQIPFGVDIKQFGNSNPDKLIEKYNLQNKCVISYVGRISPHKNIGLLIRSLPALLKAKKDIVLFIVGDDSGDYEKEKLRLLDIAKNLKVDANIKFTGLVKDLPIYYEISDLIVCASLHEGCWVPGLEAIASKKPVIASDNTAIPYTVGKAGVYFNPVNEKDFIKKVLLVLKDKELRGRLKKAAERQIQNLSLEAHDKMFIDLINIRSKTKKENKIVEKINPSELIERLRMLDQMKDIRIDYHEFSDRKIIGIFLSKFRDLVTRHIRKFYIKELEVVQGSFNNAVVESYRTLLDYLAEKENWKTKINRPVLQMSEKELYDRDYFVGGNKSNYGDYKEASGVLEDLAEMVFKLFKPKTLLDVGCAYGFLPIHLRKMGVAAYGTDISDWAISQGNKDYLSVGDATNLSEFKDRQFEIVTASELMEHVPENKIDAAIQEAKRVSKKYIIYLIAMTGFTSHDSIHDHDISHVSMKNRKFWLKKFDKFKLTRDIEKENILNTNKLSVKMGWSGRFFVLRLPNND